MVNTFNFSFDINLPQYIFTDGGGCKVGENFMKDTLQRYQSYLCGEYRKKLTRINYYNCAKRFLEFVNNNINYETIEQWKIWANNHYKRKASLNSNINAINVFLKWINKPEYRLKTLPPEETNEYSLTEKEYDKLIIESRQNLETAIIFELLNHLIRPSTIINIKLKNRDKDTLYLDDTKTGNNHIIMSKQLQELWDKYLLIRPIPLPEYQEYLIIDNDPNWRGHKYKTTLPIRNRIQELGLKANIDKKVKPYTIRRTSITLRLDKNSKYFAGDPKLVQMMARHKKLSTTMKYDRKSDNDIRQYHMSLNDIETKKPDSLSVDKLYRLLIV